MPTETLVFLYFAYGSNMLNERLQKRCPSAKPLGLNILSGYTINFTKLSKKDNSGKATILKTENSTDVVYGVLFEISLDESTKLDRAEGLGYGYEKVSATFVHNNSEVSASTYIATPDAIDDTLKPYDWYLDLVLAGSEQHSLPKKYVESILRVDTDIDPYFSREERLEAIALIGAIRSSEK